MSLKKKVSQIVKSAMYDDLIEEHKKLLINYDLLLLKHEQAMSIIEEFKEYKELQQKRTKEFSNLINNILSQPKGSDRDVS